MTPSVSIVLPTFNGSRFIGASIESCLMQSYTDFELLIVDDASTDDTPACIARYAERDARIVPIHHDRNRKLPAALNTGFANSRGRFLTWTSDDNCYRPNAIQELLAFLEHESRVSFVYSDYTVIDDRSAPIRAVTVRAPSALAETNGIGPCFLYRRAVYDRVGAYDEDLVLAEDYDYWLRVSCAHRMVPVHKDLYLYRVHDGSLTVRRRTAVRLAAEQALLRSLPRMKFLSPEERAIGYLALCRYAESRGARETARQFLRCGVRCSPRAIARRAGREAIVEALLGKRAADRLSMVANAIRKFGKRRHAAGRYDRPPEAGSVSRV